MASLIRTRLSDLSTRGEVGTFGEETFGDENLPTCAPSGLEPPTYHILGRQHCLVQDGLNNSVTKAGEFKISETFCWYIDQNQCTATTI